MPSLPADLEAIVLNGADLGDHIRRHRNNRDRDHAVVVVGMEGNEVLINDPAFPIPAIRVSIGDFDLAWFEGMERYAVLVP